MAILVQRALGDESPRKQLSGTVQVTQRASRYQALLHISDTELLGERTLEGARCDELADSVALVIALAASGASDDHRKTAGTPFVIALSAHGTSVLGPLPKLAFGVGAAAALEGAGSTRWELSGSYYAAQSDTYPQLSVGAQFRMFRLAARGCRIWSIDRVDLAPCLGAAVYRIDGQGVGGRLRNRGGSYVWGPELSLLIRWHFARHFALQLSGGAALALSRQRFTYIDLGTLHQPAALAYQWLIAPEVLF